MSMILYLFYNSDLLTDVERMEMKVGYIDDVNFFVEGPTFNEAYSKLSNMMMRDGGGLDWYSRFEMSKLTLIGFSCRRMQDPVHPRKVIAEPWPSFSLNGTIIKPAKAHKFVGTIFDQELRWKMQADRVIAKATKWVLASCCLARPAAGIFPHQMRQLYQVVAVPSFTYTTDVWFMPICRDTGDERFRGFIGTARKLTTVQCMATAAVTGVLHTSTSDIMEAHANLMPIELLLNKVCHRAALQLAALLESHPLYKPVCQST